MRHGRCPHCRPAQARQHGGQVKAAIEAIAELAQVARQMLAAEMMVGTLQAVFVLPVPCLPLGMNIQSRPDRVSGRWTSREYGWA